MIRRIPLLKAFLLVSILAAGCSRAGPPGGAGQKPGAVPQPDKELGAFERVPGTDVRVAPILQLASSGGSWNLSAGKYREDAVHNYVFLDVGTERFVRLLPSNSWVIVAKTGFPEPVPGASVPVTTTSFLYEIVKADTNADGKLSSQDRITLALSNVAGGDYGELIVDVEEVHTKVMRIPSTLLVIYRKEGKSHMARIDLKSKDVVQTSELPSFGPDVR